LLTADKDFGELIFRQGMVSSGVVLVRLAGHSPEAKAEILTAAIEEYESEFEFCFRCDHRKSDSNTTNAQLTEG